MSRALLIRQRRAEQREEEIKNQRVTVLCAHCKGRRFKFFGPVREAHERFADHRAQAHPDLAPLERLQTIQRRARRQATVGMMSHTKDGFWGRREFLSAEELREREELRRLSRSDLAPLNEEAA